MPSRTQVRPFDSDAVSCETMIGIFMIKLKADQSPNEVESSIDLRS